MTYTITPLIGEQAIAARVRELAASIDADMGDRPYVLLRLLDGAVPFASMLAEHLKSRPEVRSVKVSSYSGMESSGSVAWRGDCGAFRPGVPVLVVDDVLDTGRTLAGVCGELKKRGVQRVLTAVAVDKHCCRKVPFEADYVAFTWGDDFLVGVRHGLGQPVPRPPLHRQGCRRLNKFFQIEQTIEKKVSKSLGAVEPSAAPPNKETPERRFKT